MTFQQLINAARELVDSFGVHKAHISVGVEHWSRPTGHDETQIDIYVNQVRPLMDTVHVYGSTPEVAIAQLAPAIREALGQPQPSIVESLGEVTA